MSFHSNSWNQPKEKKIPNLWRSDLWDHEQYFRDTLKNDPTKELIQLLREDSERLAKYDQMFLQPMQSMIINNNQARNPVFQQTTHSQHPISVVMNSDFSKKHSSRPDTPVFHQQYHGMSKQIIGSSPNITNYQIIRYQI